MSSAKSRNFRRRGDDDDNNSDSATNAPFPATSSKSSSSFKPKKLLSFADDEDDEVPSSRISKSSSSRKPTSSHLAKGSSSHKLITSKDRLPPTPSSTTSNVLPQAGTYTKEALLELQKNTRTLAKPSSSASKSSSEPKIVLKGLLKPPQEEPSTDTLKKTQQLDSEGEDQNHEERNDAENRLASLGLGKSKDYSLIPDEETIKKIRAKRERLRQSRAAAPDYISLDIGPNHGLAEGLSDEEPEFRTRISLMGKKDSSSTHGVFDNLDTAGDDNGHVKAMIGSATAVRYSSNVMTEEGTADADDEDEEDKIWEEEQVRKGLGKRMDDSSGTNASFTTSSTTIMHNHQHQQRQLKPVMYGSVPSIGSASGASQGLDALSIPQQAEIARKALQDNARRLKESHNRTVSSLTKTDDSLSSSLMNITALEKSLSAAGEKFIFMQKLRDFVSVICEFLQHKAPYIEELEEQMQKLHEQRAFSLLERRNADNGDEIAEVEAAVKAAVMVFNECGSSSAVITAASSAAQAAIATMKERTNLPVKLDEFGRDINQQKRMDIMRRAEARQRRKDRFEARRLLSMEVDVSDQKVEGESSTDESDSESAAYESNRDMLLQTADQIFGDASEEYSELSLVKERFERWKKEYSTSYRDAYMSLSAAAIFSPYVRLELLKWDPLHQDVDFYDMKWHSLLFSYGLPEDGSDFSPDDADGNLIPEIVEKVAIPILHHEISHCWDMLSTQETKNAVSATSLVTNYVPASSEALSELLVTVHTRLADAVANIMVPTWSPLVLKAVPSAARIAAYRFGMSVRLMKNICLWKDILALPVLEKLALDELLCGKVLPHVRSVASNIHDAVTRTERIVASLSGLWAGPNVTGEPSNKLRHLVDFVMSLGRALEKKHMSGVTETETYGLARRLKKMLVELNDYDNARDIARTFSLREAL